MNSEFMWTMLVHLGSNMWNEEGNTKGRIGRSNCDASPVLRFDRKLWDEQMLRLKNSGVNTLMIDIGEAMRYESHPELAVEGSWTHEQMRAELQKLRGMGFEIIPKLNFSACHDIWLKDYSRMLSTPVYYQVCKDIINEVCDVFEPKHFHLGMDEEGYPCQRHFDYAVIRQGDLWWHDLYYLVDLVEKRNARAWVWSDYMWNHPDEYLSKMPKTVLQNNWCYNCADQSPEASYASCMRCFDLLDRAGYDQMPTASTYTSYENMVQLTQFCAPKIAPEHFKGMMQTVWERIADGWMHKHEAAARTLHEAKMWLENQ